jgi:glycosyltransferase involved in cell wall biosynthesis
MAAARLVGGWTVGVSRELQQRLALALHSRRVVRISNPVSRSDDSFVEVGDLRRQFGWPARYAIIVFVGRLERVKGPDRLLEVLRRMRTDAGIVLLGSGSLDQSLREDVRDSGLEFQVRLVGEISDVRPYLAQADVLAVPSRHEGVPMIILEAAAQALPVVGFAVGGVPELLDGGPAARLVRADDLDAFAAALDEVLEQQSEVRSAAARWARSLSAEFELGTVVSAYLSVYRGEHPDPSRAAGDSRAGDAPGDP